jgi:hypothetical protein
MEHLKIGDKACWYELLPVRRFPWIIEYVNHHIHKKLLRVLDRYVILNLVTKFFEQDFLNPGMCLQGFSIFPSIIQKPCFIPEK